MFRTNATGSSYHGGVENSLVSKSMEQNNFNFHFHWTLRIIWVFLEQHLKEQLLTGRNNYFFSLSLLEGQ